MKNDHPHRNIPTTSTRRRALSIGIGAALLASCRRGASRSPVRRCAFCGMRVPDGSHWAAGARDAQGADLAFDTPACVFRFRFSPRGRGLHDEWMTEYYGPAGARTPARELHFVAGSDVVGPMGADLIPVQPARAQSFLADHHGRRTLRFDEVTADVIAHLD